MSASPMDLDVDLGPMPKEGEHFLQQGLRGLLQSQELCDVALVSSGGAAFPAHRAVLAASSPQLRARVAMLDYKIQVDGLPALQLDVQHSEAVKALIDCVYGTGENCDGCYNPSSEEANRDVLALARNFELSALEDRASRWLARNLTTANLLDRVSTCERFGLNDVKDKILEQLTANTDVLYELVSDPSVRSVPGVLQDLLLRVLQLLGCGPPVSSAATKDQPIQADA
ncbi:unnamed protein product [Cladocopium goreaui]|uniref:BTB domain-containing protein n=1 Tax=Cladocopium goreaui TaxID=2562237 RepID=A0A9P1BT56_9DINO|nr:unnamed protein product [Cladocopium goreaui]|mmetsp:Transcript_67347/g.147571  ORF Transcript_67347/g.147571 Transcript_67347/m.147571 type:complete len:228 (+) Transcript_67347:83-766(+)